MELIINGIDTEVSPLLKPQKLNIGDTIATISPSWGCAGGARVKWE